MALRGTLIRCATPVPPDPTTHPWKHQRVVPVDGIIMVREPSRDGGNTKSRDGTNRIQRVRGVYQAPKGPAAVFSTEPFAGSLDTWDADMTRRKFHVNPTAARWLCAGHPRLRCQLKPVPRHTLPCPPPKPPVDVLIKTFVIPLDDDTDVSADASKHANRSPPTEPRYSSSTPPHPQPHLHPTPQPTPQPTLCLQPTQCLQGYLTWDVLSKYFSG